MMKNFNIFWGHWKIQFLGEGGGFTKNQFRGKGLPKKGRGAWQEGEGDVY